MQFKPNLMRLIPELEQDEQREEATLPREQPDNNYFFTIIFFDDNLFLTIIFLTKTTSEMYVASLIWSWSFWYTWYTGTHWYPLVPDVT